MVDAVFFPPLLMRESSVSWKIMASTFSPGQTSSGAFPFGRLDGGGLWAAQLTNVNLRTPDQVRAWRAVEAAAESGVVPLIVPSCDKRFFPAPIVDGRPLYSYGSVPHDDDTFFDDGSGYSQPVVVSAIVGDAALRATTLTLFFTAGSALRGGEVFSIEHLTQGHRRYVIKTAIPNDDGSVAITFRPPLREAMPSGTYVEFDEPKCLMRLSQPNAMDLDLDLRKFGSPSVSFIEYPPL